MSSTENRDVVATRRLALELLLACDRRGPTLDEQLAHPDVTALPRRERAFLHELVLGTLRRRGGIDFALQAVCDRPLDRMQAGVRNLLRLGAHQVLHLRVPDHAAVAESVALARRRFPRAAGFVNAVLRRLARQGSPVAPDPEHDPLGWLTTEGSLPDWLAERWMGQLGPRTAVARARILLEPPATVLRFNPRTADARQRLQQAEVQVQPLTVPGAWLVLAGQAWQLAEEGLLYFQDQGSQLVAHLAAEGRPPALDACAAPGGKSALLTDLWGPASVVAMDHSRARVEVMARLLRRWGAVPLGILTADARRPPFAAPFQTVLVDAPCSGLGTLARHPDLRWRARQADIPRHAARQADMLGSLAPLVAPGGRLVYATCSLEPEENEQVVEGFLTEQPGFSPAPPPPWAEPFRDGIHFRTRPEEHGGDGFFAAVLVRAGVC